jgi:hypothetical protein
MAAKAPGSGMHVTALPAPPSPQLALGRARLQFTAYECDDQVLQRPVQRQVDLDPALAYR